jgi:hypothetical protein
MGKSAARVIHFSREMPDGKTGKKGNKRLVHLERSLARALQRLFSIR